MQGFRIISNIKIPDFGVTGQSDIDPFPLALEPQILVI